MKEQVKNNFENELVGVIESAKKIRDYMLDTETPLAERKQEIATFRTANAANKSIVSAIINTIALEKLSE